MIVMDKELMLELDEERKELGISDEDFGIIIELALERIGNSFLLKDDALYEIISGALACYDYNDIESKQVKRKTLNETIEQSARNLGL